MKPRTETTLFNVFMYIVIGILPGIGFPMALTWSLSGHMAEWSPFSLLLLLIVIVVWLLGLVWIGFLTIAFLMSIFDKDTK